MVILMTPFILYIFMLLFIMFPVILYFLFCVWSLQYLKSLGEMGLKMYLLTSAVSCFVVVWWFLLSSIFPDPDSISLKCIPSERICIFFCWDWGILKPEAVLFLIQGLRFNRSISGLAVSSCLSYCWLVFAF